MKIIIYTGAFRFPIGDAAAQRVLNNAKILRELGYNVIFVSFGGCFQESDKGEDGNYYYDGFRYIISHDIDLKEYNIVKRIHNFIHTGQRAVKLINEMTDNLYMIIGYNPSMFFTNKIQSLCSKNNISFVADITEWSDSNEFPGGGFAPPAWINNFNMSFTQKKVKNKILISSYLDKFYKSSNNIVLPPLVDSSDMKWSYSSPVLPYFEGVRVIYAGTPGKKDLLETILDAVFSCLKRGLKLQFVVVGVTKDDISHYKNYQDILTMPDSIIFCGRVLQTEVPSYYKVSDFSIIVRESTRKSMAGFPTKLVEAQMAGVPIVVNHTSDIKKFIKDGFNGYVLANHSVEKIIECLENIVLLSEEKISIMKNNARKTSLENFNFNEYSNDVKIFLKNLN